MKFQKKNSTYISPKIENEFIYIFYEFFIESLRNESDKASCITLCIDKTTVISKVEQLVVALRYFIDFKVFERFIPFFDCYSWLESISDLKDFSLIRKNIASIVIECLEQIEFDSNKICFFTTDQASPLTGTKNGTIAYLKCQIPHIKQILCSTTLFILQLELK